MLNCLMIFIGGGLGSVLRYLINIFGYKHFGSNYPWGTFSVNILGCLFLGFVVAVALNKTNLISSNIKLFLTVGFAGGFTTFSTFSYESLALIKEGHTFTSLLYLSSSIIFGLLSVYFGAYLAKYV